LVVNLRGRIMQSKVYVNIVIKVFCKAKAMRNLGHDQISSITNAVSSELDILRDATCLYSEALNAKHSGRRSLIVLPPVMTSLNGVC